MPQIIAHATKSIKTLNSICFHECCAIRRRRQPISVFIPSKPKLQVDHTGWQYKKQPLSIFALTTSLPNHFERFPHLNYHRFILNRLGIAFTGRKNEIYGDGNDKTENGPPTSPVSIFAQTKLNYCVIMTKDPFLKGYTPPLQFHPFFIFLGCRLWPPPHLPRSRLNLSRLLMDSEGARGTDSLSSPISSSQLQALEHQPGNTRKHHQQTTFDEETSKLAAPKHNRKYKTEKRTFSTKITNQVDASIVVQSSL